MTIRTGLSAVLAVVMLAACGGGGSSAPSTGSGSGSGGGTTPPTPDPLTQALESGDTSFVTNDATYLDAILETIMDGQSRYNAAKQELFQLTNNGGTDSNSLTSLSWDPTHDSGRILPVFPHTSTIIETNLAREGYDLRIQPMAAIGENEQVRYMAFGANPFRHPDRLSEDMDSFLENALSWLTKGDFGSAAPNVVIAQTDESFYFPDETTTRNWINTRFGEGTVTFNDIDACDGDALADCLTTADLLIISDRFETDEEALQIRNTVEQAMSDGVPVFYMHRNWGFGTLAAELLDLMNMRWGGHNYWSRSLVENYDPSVLHDTLPDNVASIQTTISHFKEADFTLDLSACSDRSCPEGSAYYSEFGDGSSAVRDMLSGLQTRKVDLFNEPDNRLEKLLVLLGDRWRQEAVFPMDKNITSRREFLMSLFADHADYIHRPLNPVQSDLGNYSRSDFSHVTAQTRTVNMTAQQNYRSSSAYALPGQTFTITRTDSAAVSTSVQINSLRTGSVHIFEDEGYVRPRYAGASSRFAIEPGETLELTSAYGGPIHIYFGGEGEEVSFDFENVGSHPYWKGSEDDGDFNAAMIAAEYDWVEFGTPHFEITSTFAKFEETMSHDFIAGNPQQLADYISRYHHNIPRALGGYSGDGIDVSPEVTDFAQTHGLQTYEWNGVQHMNADQATCGYGCSGNPYDAWWDFSPLGHGDLHEVGHGLETRRIMFSEWSGHAATNWYSYYPKLQFHKETGLDSGCQSLPYQRLFDELQESQNQSDPIAHMEARDYEPWQNGASIMIQMAAAMEHENILQDGWMLLPRLHMIARAYWEADNNDESWLAGRDAIGFSGLTRNEAIGLSNEDWLMIATSHASGRNMSDYFEMWGAVLTPLAKAQVAASGYPAMPMNFFAMNETDHCYADLGDSVAVTIDGVSDWPLVTTASDSHQKTQLDFEDIHPDHGPNIEQVGNIHQLEPLPH